MADFTRLVNVLAMPIERGSEGPALSGYRVLVPHVA